MSNSDPNPFFVPLAAILTRRGVDAELAVHLDQAKNLLRAEQPLMSDLKCTAPLLAAHRFHPERRMVVALEHSLDAWRERIRRRGINMISVSSDGLIANAEGIADQVCRHIYRVDPEDLLEMVQQNMPLKAIEAFTGIDTTELSRIITKFYGKTIGELRAEVQ